MTFLAGFNSSVWDGVLIGALTFLVVLLLARRSLKDDYYYFDAKHTPGVESGGDFTAHSQRYNDLAKLIITLSVAAMAFLFNSLVTSKSGNVFDIRVTRVAPIVVGLFGCATTFWLTFIFAQTWFYEVYCHSPNHDSYTRWRYAFCISLAISGCVSFVLGFLWLAVNTFVTE